MIVNVCKRVYDQYIEVEETFKVEGRVDGGRSNPPQSGVGVAKRVGGIKGSARRRRRANPDADQDDDEVKVKLQCRSMGVHFHDREVRADDKMRWTICLSRTRWVFIFLDAKHRWGV